MRAFPSNGNYKLSCEDLLHTRLFPIFYQATSSHAWTALEFFVSFVFVWIFQQVIIYLVNYISAWDSPYRLHLIWTVLL